MPSILNRLTDVDFRVLFLQSPAGRDMLENAEAERMAEHRELVAEIAAAEKEAATATDKGNAAITKARQVEATTAKAHREAVESLRRVQGEVQTVKHRAEQRIATAMERLRALADDRVQAFRDELMAELENSRSIQTEYDYQRQWNATKGDHDVAVAWNAPSIRARLSYLIDRVRDNDRLLMIPLDKLDAAIDAVRRGIPAVVMTPIV